MSKLLKDLQGVRELRNGSPSLPLTPSSQTEKSDPVLSRPVFFLILGVVAWIGLGAITLSLKAYAQIRQQSTATTRVAEIIKEQSETIQSLEKTIAQLRVDFKENGDDLKKSLLSIDDEMSENEQEISKLSKDNKSVHVAVDDLKKAQRDLSGKYWDLSDELKVIKSLSAQKVGWIEQ